MTRKKNPSRSADAPARKSPPRELTPEQAVRVQKELIRRAEALRKVDFRALCRNQETGRLHEPQHAFVTDQSRFSAAVCGRQCGKTEGVVIKALDVCSRTPHVVVPYITLSRPAAKRNMWPKLHRFNRDLGLGATFNGTELSMTLPNGSKIILGGANDEAEIERYRGMSTPLCLVDEAQAFRHYLRDLVTNVLFPATVAYNGQVVLIGTPNPSCTGYFHDITNSVDLDQAWSTHHWDIMDNVFQVNPGPSKALEDARRLQGYTNKTPAYRREWLGEWVREEEGLVYNIRRSNIVRALPAADDWCYVLGIDVGYVDATAFVVLAYSPVLGQTYVVESFQKTELIPSAIVAHVDRLFSRYDFESVVVDPGGGGKFIVEELAQRYALPAMVAEKRAKHAAIELLNGDIRSQTFFILRDGNEDLIHDANLHLWDYKKAGANTGGFRQSEKRIESDRTPNHLLDAMLYGWRKCRSYLWDPEREKARPGTPEYMEVQEREMIERAIAKASGQSESGAFWEEGF